jgi:hypothetical protein
MGTDPSTLTVDDLGAVEESTGYTAWAVASGDPVS